MQKTMTKIHKIRKTDDSETYLATPVSGPVKSITGNFEIDFSNEKNSVLTTDYWKTKLEVVEKSKNKKCRQTDEHMSQGDST